MKNFLKILFSTIIIIFVPIHIFAQSKNELVIGIGTTQGKVTNAKGIHGPVTGNAGTNVKHQIKNIIEKIFIYKNKKKELKTILNKMHKNKTKGEILVQFMDYKKLNLFLKWKPKYKFEQTIPELFKWYQSYFRKNR